MSVKRGLLRLLTALSILYWISAAIFAYYSSEAVVGQCDGKYPSKELFYACRAEMLPVFGLIMGLALILFGVIWAAYLTVGWIVRGFQGPA